MIGVLVCQLSVPVGSVVGKQVPLRILYATTTGTARDFATQMQVGQSKEDTKRQRRGGKADFGVM